MISLCAGRFRLCGQGVDFQGQSGDFSCRGILMEDTLGAGLLDERDGLQQGLSGSFDILLGNGYSHLFYRGLYC